MSKIKIYKDNPTAGGTDGTVVSSDDWSSPVASGTIKVPEEGYEEGDWIPLAVRCDENYETVLDDGKHAVLSIEDSANVDKWQLAPDDGAGNADSGNAETWGSSMDITSQISDENLLFHVRARAEAGEDPQNDKTCQAKVVALIGEQES